MPEEYSNTTGGAGATVKGRPLDEGSCGWEEGGVSEKYSEAAASRLRFQSIWVLDLVVNRQVRGRARHSSGRLQVSRKRLSYSDKEQVSTRKTAFVIFGSLAQICLVNNSWKNIPNSIGSSQLSWI